MSIYATGRSVGIEIDEDDAMRPIFWEVYFQHVPNHINEQNGYGGPDWDEWLPAFVHRPDCTMRKGTISNSRTGEAYDWHECYCGDRAVFVCDDLTTKATPRNGQEYVNPVLVLTGAEYRSIGWCELMERIETSVSERRAAADHGERLYLTDEERDLILAARAAQAKRDADERRALGA
jgi:hypothetical protein